MGTASPQLCSRRTSWIGWALNACDPISSFSGFIDGSPILVANTPKASFLVQSNTCRGQCRSTALMY